MKGLSTLLPQCFYTEQVTNDLTGSCGKNKTEQRLSIAIFSVRACVRACVPVWVRMCVCLRACVKAGVFIQGYACARQVLTYRASMLTFAYCLDLPGIQLVPSGHFREANSFIPWHSPQLLVTLFILLFP